MEREIGEVKTILHTWYWTCNHFFPIKNLWCPRRMAYESWKIIKTPKLNCFGGMERYDGENKYRASRVYESGNRAISGVCIKEIDIRATDDFCGGNHVKNHEG